MTRRDLRRSFHSGDLPYKTGRRSALNRPAIQALIDQAGDLSISAGRVRLEMNDGETVTISSTVLVDKKTLVLNGSNSVFQWGGAIGDPVFRVIDSSRCVFRDLVVIGDAANRPMAGFFFESPLPARTLGTNENISVDGVIIGRRYQNDMTGTWPTNAGLENGIVVGGAFDGNNDEYIIRNVQIDGVTGVGIDFRNTQSIWTSIENCLINQADIGLKAGCNLSVTNLNCNRIATADVQGVRKTLVTINGFNSEHANCFIASSSGAGFIVRGGKLVKTTPNPGNFFHHASGGLLSLEGLIVTSTGAGKQVVRYTGTHAAGFTNRIHVRNCEILGGNDRDTWVVDTGGLPCSVDIDHGRMQWKTNGMYVDREVTPPSISANTSANVASGFCSAPSGRFWHAAYSGSHEGQHITVARENGSQLRATIHNSTGAASQLPTGRMRWMDLADLLASRGMATVSPGTIGPGGRATSTITVPGAQVGDYTAVISDVSAYVNLSLSSYVSAPSTVTIVIHNSTGGPAAPPAGAMYAASLRAIGNFHGAAIYAPEEIANGATVAIATIDVPGARLGSHAFVSFSSDLKGLFVTPQVTADNTVIVIATNRTGAAVTLEAGFFKAMAAF